MCCTGVLYTTHWRYEKKSEMRVLRYIEAFLVRILMSPADVPIHRFGFRFLLRSSRQQTATRHCRPRLEGYADTTTRQRQHDSGMFSCHVDCATGCHTDDQPFDHPYAYHPPSFEDNASDEEEELRSPKSYDPQQENSNFDKDEESTRGPVSGQQTRSGVPSPHGVVPLDHVAHSLT